MKNDNSKTPYDSYLESLESGFAGNMIAILANKLKTDVSRRYLPDLEKELGL